MRLVRVATINTDGLSENHRSWEASVGDVTVRTIGYFERGATAILLVVGEVVLAELPDVNKRNEVVVPKVCRNLEAAIELMANALSISQRSRRSVSSADPPVALVPESDAERAWLSSPVSFAFPDDRRQSISFMIPPCDALALLPELKDRPDGLALLAEALSHEHASGRFKELIRFFERAFRAATASLVKALSEFLKPAPYGYDKAEIRSWIIGVRHPLVHADRRPDFLMEADVRHLLPRVEQAAYDVLMNKVTWRAPDSARRQLWIPDAINTPTGSVVKQHSTPTLRGQLLDVLGVYPMNLQANITNPPADWWYGFPSAQGKSDAS